MDSVTKASISVSCLLLLLLLLEQLLGMALLERESETKTKKEKRVVEVGWVDFRGETAIGSVPILPSRIWKHPPKLGRCSWY